MPRPRAAIGGALALLLVLHQDVWLAGDGRLLFGLPVSLAYHVGYCLACGVVMVLLVRFAWPKDAEGDDGGDGG